MSETAGSVIGCPEELELLVFRIRDVNMGVDTGQIAAMLKPSEAKSRGIAVTGLYEILDCGAVCSYEDPHVLVLRREGRIHGIVVDRPHEIFSVKIDAIRPMPSFLMAAGGQKAVWGAVLRGEQCIMLIDFLKLLGGS